MFYFFFPKTLLSAERSVWLCCWHFFGVSFFLAWFRGPILSAGSGTTKRPDCCSNWCLSVWNFDQNCTQHFNIVDGDLHKNAIKTGVSSKMREAKKRPQNDQFESWLGAHKRAGSGSTNLSHFGRFMLVLKPSLCGPRTVTQGLCSAEQSLFWKFGAPNWLVWGWCGPASGCPAYIYML